MGAVIKTDGLFITKFGVDPLSTDEFNMLFSSNFATLRKIGSGAVQFGGGWNGSNSSRVGNGATDFGVFVPYADGVTRTNPLPFVAAMSMAPDYTLHLGYRDSNNNQQFLDFNQFGGYNNVYLACPVFEKIAMPMPTDPTYGRIKFTMLLVNTGVFFYSTNYTSVVTVKYIMFDPANAT